MHLKLQFSFFTMLTIVQGYKPKKSKEIKKEKIFGRHTICHLKKKSKEKKKPTGEQKQEKWNFCPQN